MKRKTTEKQKTKSIPIFTLEIYLQILQQTN